MKTFISLFLLGLLSVLATGCSSGTILYADKDKNRDIELTPGPNPILGRHTTYERVNTVGIDTSTDVLGTYDTKTGEHAIYQKVSTDPGLFKHVLPAAIAAGSGAADAVLGRSDIDVKATGGNSSSNSSANSSSSSSANANANASATATAPPYVHP